MVWQIILYVVLYVLRRSPVNPAPPSTECPTIMPPFMDAMCIPAGPTVAGGGPTRRMPAAPRPAGGRTRQEGTRRPAQRNTAPAAAPAIIDSEKMKRMDGLADDDWGRQDEDFDYSKKLMTSATDEPAAVEKLGPNWADQVHKKQNQRMDNFGGGFKNRV